MIQPNLSEYLKDQGQALVESHNQDFVTKMREVAQYLSFRNGSVTSDDLRQYAQRNGITPKHPNAWGSIFKAGSWRSTGYTRSTLASNHARTIRVWVYTGA